MRRLMIILLCVLSFAQNAYMWHVKQHVRRKDFSSNQGNDDTECEDPHEVLKPSTGSCEATCLDPIPLCPVIYATLKCTCRKNYVRLTPGERCVHKLTCNQMTYYEKKELESDCPGENEEFSICGRHCQPTCEFPTGIFPVIGHCLEQCRVGCYCKPGYLRANADHGAKCIRTEDCPFFPYNLPGFDWSELQG